MRLTRFALVSFLLLLISCRRGPERAGGPTPVSLRVALFDIRELSTAKLIQRDGSGAGDHPQARHAADIIQRHRPDVLVINEMDHDRSAVDLPPEPSRPRSLGPSFRLDRRGLPAHEVAAPEP